MTNTNPVNQEIFSVVAQAEFEKVFRAICGTQSVSEVVITNGRAPNPRDFKQHIGDDTLLVALINTDQSIKAIDPKGNYASFETRAAQFYKDCAELGINALVIGFDDRSACNGIRYVYWYIVEVNDFKLNDFSTKEVDIPIYLKHDGCETSVEEGLAYFLGMPCVQYQRTGDTATPIAQGEKEQQELLDAILQAPDTSRLVFTVPAQYVYEK